MLLKRKEFPGSKGPELKRPVVQSTSVQSSRFQESEV